MAFYCSDLVHTYDFTGLWCSTFTSICAVQAPLQCCGATSLKMRFVYYHPTSIPEEALQVGDTALVVVGRAKRQSCHVSSKQGMKQGAEISSMLLAGSKKNACRNSPREVPLGACVLGSDPRPTGRPIGAVPHSISPSLVQHKRCAPKRLCITVLELSFMWVG